MLLAFNLEEANCFKLVLGTSRSPPTQPLRTSYKPTAARRSRRRVIMGGSVDQVLVVGSYTSIVSWVPPSTTNLPCIVTPAQECRTVARFEFPGSHPHL